MAQVNSKTGALDLRQITFAFKLQQFFSKKLNYFSLQFQLELCIDHLVVPSRLGSGGEPVLANAKKALTI